MSVSEVERWHVGEGFEEQLGPQGLLAMEQAGMADDGLMHVATRQYSLDCNWKVFCDNYLVSVVYPPVSVLQPSPLSKAILNPKWGIAPVRGECGLD
jgi:hypothetical protein